VVEWVAEDITGRVAREVQALHGDAKARIRVGDELMRLLLRIDAVRGARDYRRRVARRVLKLQDDVNALEQSPMVEEVEAEAADLSGSEENNSKMEDKLAAEMATEVEVEVDGGRAVRDGVVQTSRPTRTRRATASGSWSPRNLRPLSRQLPTCYT
jgi:hypothetical protein